MVITSSGCGTFMDPTTTRTTVASDSHTIEPEALQAYREDPSVEKLRVKVGDTIGVYPKEEKFDISSRDLTYVQMMVTDIDTTRIKGEILWAAGDYSDGFFRIVGKIVEVKLDDINVIDVYETRSTETTLKPGIKPFFVVMLSLLFYGFVFTVL